MPPSQKAVTKNPVPVEGREAERIAKAHKAEEAALITQLRELYTSPHCPDSLKGLIWAMGDSIEWAQVPVCLVTLKAAASAVLPPTDFFFNLLPYEGIEPTAHPLHQWLVYQSG